MSKIKLLPPNTQYSLSTYTLNVHAIIVYQIIMSIYLSSKSKKGGLILEVNLQ